jgi:hypothetical protein
MHGIDYAEKTYYDHDSDHACEEDMETMKTSLTPITDPRLQTNLEGITCDVAEGNGLDYSNNEPLTTPESLYKVLAEGVQNKSDLERINALPKTYELFYKKRRKKKRETVKAPPLSWWARVTRYLSSFFKKTQKGGKIRWVEKRDALHSLGLNGKFTKKHLNLLKRLKINSTTKQQFTERDWQKLIREEDRRYD